MLLALISSLSVPFAHSAGSGTMTGSGTGIYDMPLKRTCGVSSVDVVAVVLVPGNAAVLELAGNMTTPMSRWWFCVRNTVTPASSSWTDG